MTASASKLRHISDITPFDNENIHWRALYDHQNCCVVIWDDSKNIELCRICAGGGGGGDTIESGAFGISADGSSGTINGSPVVPVMINPTTFKMTIPTTKKLKIGFFNSGFDVGGVFVYSQGTSDGVRQSFIGGNGNNFLGSQVDVIGYKTGTNNGWTAQVSAIGIIALSYDVVWTRIGAGLPAQVQWHGITG